MKRKYTKGSKMPAKPEDDCSPASPKGNMDLQSKRLTRSQAALLQKCPVQIPEIALNPKKGTKGAASKSPKLTCAQRAVKKNDGVFTTRGKLPTEEKGTKTKGTTCKSPKLTCARRFVEESDGVSTNRGKPSMEEFTDETAHNETQDTYPFLDSFKKFLARENADLQQPIVSASPSSNEFQNILPNTGGKEKNGAQEAHSFQLTEMAAMMNCGPSDAHVEVHQPRNPTTPSSTRLVQNNFLAKEKNAAQKAPSFGFTEMAAMMYDSPSGDEEEADSSLNLISVEGYLVKKEIAPMLKKIIDKYKDIAKECTIKEKKSHVPSLEVICLTCQKLGETSFKDVKDEDLKGMLLVVQGIQHMGFDVTWLSERLEDISKLKRLINLRPVLKEGSTKLDSEEKKIRMLEQRIDVLKQQLSTAEADFFAKKMEHDKASYVFKQDMTHLTPKEIQHWSNDLLYGLI